MQPASIGFLLGLLFDPDDGADIPLKHHVLSEQHYNSKQNTLHSHHCGNVRPTNFMHI
jgi:hypothetical protein